MPKSDESPVESAGASEAAPAPAPAPAPEASPTPGPASRASQIFAKAETAVASELAGVEKELSHLEQVVLSWCNEHFTNSPVSRATEALNYLRVHAVPDLLNKIKGI